MTETEALIVGLVLIAYGCTALHWSMDLYGESGESFECDFSAPGLIITNASVRFGAKAFLVMGLLLLTAGPLVAIYAPG